VWSTCADRTQTVVGLRYTLFRFCALVVVSVLFVFSVFGAFARRCLLSVVGVAAVVAMNDTNN
jgi:hypothetical protein